MAFQLPPLPSFQIQPPDVFGSAQKMMQLKALMGQQQFEQQQRPMQLQQMQQQLEASSLQNQKAQQELDSEKALQKAIAGGAFTKYAGVDTPDGSGFDAGKAFQDLIANNPSILPDHASRAVNSILDIAKNQAEIRKTQGQAGEAQQNIRAKTLDQVAAKLGSIGDMPADKATEALEDFKNDLVKNRSAYPGLTQLEAAHLYATTLDHLGAAEQLMGLEGKIAEFHKTKSAAAKEAQGVIPPGQTMSPDTQQQVSKDVAVATDPRIQAGKVAVAESEGRARALVEQQMARGSNAALANVPQHLIAPATADATKAGTEYAQAKSVSDRLSAMMDAAKKGNVVSYQLIPEEGALQVTTSQGVHRINMAEIQNYGGGSLWQRLEGHIGKTLTGQSIPDSVLKDMAEMQEIQSKGSKTKYENTLKTINQTYGSGFKPVEMEDLSGGGAKKTLSMAAIEKAAKDHGVSVDEAKKQAQDQGYTIQ